MKPKFITRSAFFEAMYKGVKVQRHYISKGKCKKKLEKGSPTYSKQWRLWTEILNGEHEIIEIDKRDFHKLGPRGFEIRFLVKDGVLKYPRLKIKQINILQSV